MRMKMRARARAWEVVAIVIGHFESESAYSHFSTVSRASNFDYHICD